MKKYISILAIFLTSTMLLAQNSDAKLSVEALATEAIQKEEVIGLAVGIINSDGDIWNYSQGVSNRDTNTPFTTTTINRTASISKSITATAIMQLVENGQLDLNATVASYHELFNTETLKKITVRQVLQHTSGLTGYKNSKEANNKKQYNSFEEALAIILTRGLQFESGTDFNYTSYGYNVLGLLIEKVSGMSYATYLEKYIFEPAGMTNTSLETFGKGPVGKSKIYHQKKPGKINEITTNNISDRLAGGGVQSTLEDLLKFAQAIMNNTLISSESFEAMITNHGLKKEGNGYGMGWYLYGPNDVLGNIVGHNGEQYGCSAFLFIAPEKGFATAVISNTSRYQGNGKLAMTAFRVRNELKK